MHGVILNLSKITVSQDFLSCEKPSSPSDPKSFTFEELAMKFHLRQEIAAKEFNMSLSTFRRRYRLIDVHNWPYKKVCFIKALIVGIDTNIIKQNRSS